MSNTTLVLCGFTIKIILEIFTNIGARPQLPEFLILLVLGKARRGVVVVVIVFLTS